MPKFVPMFDISESEDEIEIIPYVKPPPPVIEILNSSSGEDQDDVPLIDVYKAEKKKKRKKKRELKEAEAAATLNGLTISNKDCDDASSSSGTTSHKSTVGKNYDNVPEREIVCGSDNEQIVSNNAEPSLSTLGLEDAAVSGSLSRSDDISSTEPLPSIRIADSIFELREPPIDQSAEPILSLNNDPNPAGQMRNIAAGISKVTQSKSKAKASAAPKALPAPRQRVSKHRIASQRTNEEILNFLTTLGIPLEPQDLGPNKPVRKSRKQPVPDSSDQLPLENVSNGLPDNSLQNGITLPMENPSFPCSISTAFAPPASDLLSMTGSLVSVTDESKDSPTLRKSPKKRISHLNKRQKLDNSKAIASDLSLISFTTEELDKISLNMTTNIVCPSTDKRNKYRGKQNQISVVDSVLMQMEGLDRGECNNSTEAELTALGLGSQSPTKSDENENPSVDFVTAKNPAVEIEQPVFPSQCQKSDESDETTSLNKSLNQLLESQNELASVPFNSSLSTTTQTICKGVNELEQSLPVETSFLQTEVDSKISISHLPSHWSDEMVQFYDGIRDPELHLHDRLRSMSDNPKLWVCRRLPPKPKVSRIRCLNCNQMGHVARQCPDGRKIPCCRICGARGHTADTRGKRMCPNTKCLNCGRKQHLYSTGCRYCVNTRHPSECRTCSIVGHDESMCPDNWRRFHSVTSVVENTNETSSSEKVQYTGELAKYRLSRDMFCSNCSKKGHSYYYCRDNNRMGSYHRHKPYIVREFPETKSFPKPVIRDRIVSVQPEGNDDDEVIEIIKVHIANPAAPRGGKKSAYRIWRCFNYPDCQNYPSLGNKCHSMFVIESDHALLLKAQGDGKIAMVRLNHKVDITVLSERCIVHIWGDNHVSAIEELKELLGKLNKANKSSTPKKRKKSAAVDVPEETLKFMTVGIENVIETPVGKRGKQNNRKRTESVRTDVDVAPQPPESTEISSEPKCSVEHTTCDTDNMSLSEVSDVNEDIDDNKNIKEIISANEDENACQKAEIANPSKEQDTKVGESTDVLNSNQSVAGNDSIQEPKSPEIITLEDDDEDVNQSTPTGSLNVSLLNSEWGLIFSESTKSGGLTSKLAQQFGVTIFICKEELSCTIQSGTPENRKLAQQNIVFWLECAAANVEYKMLLGKDDYSRINHNNDIGHNNLKNKRPRIDPKPNVLAKRQRIGTSENERSTSPRPRSLNRVQNFIPIRRKGRGRFSEFEGNSDNRGESNHQIIPQDRQVNPNSQIGTRYFHQQPEYLQTQQIPPPRSTNFECNAAFSPIRHFNNNRGGRGHANDFARRGGGSSGSTRGNGNKAASKNNRLRYYNEFE